MSEILVFFVEEDYERTVGIATTDGDGLTDALSHLLDECGSNEMNGGINIVKPGRYRERPCVQIRWNDDGEPLSLFDVSGRSYSLMIGDQPLADIVADAVISYNEERADG